MWDYVICKVLGEGLVKSLFKESPEAAAKRIAEEKRLAEEKKRRERQEFIRGIPFLLFYIAVLAGILYAIWLYNK